MQGTRHDLKPSETSAVEPGVNFWSRSMDDRTNVVQFRQLSTAKQCEWIDRLFARLSAMYGSKFAAMWEGFDLAGVKSVWVEDLAEFSPSEITAGVNACKTREWPPTLPEFIRLCRPSIDYERAFYDAVEQMAKRTNGTDTWTTPAIFWAAVSLGGDLSNRPYHDLKTRWAKALDDSVAAVRSGDKPNHVPTRLEALPAPGKATLDAEKTRENLERLKAMVGLVAGAKTVASHV